MSPRIRQLRAIRAELAHRPKRGGLVIVCGRRVHGGASRHRDGSYWNKRLRISSWFRRVSRLVLTRAVQG